MRRIPALESKSRGHSTTPPLRAWSREIDSVRDRCCWGVAVPVERVSVCLVPNVFHAPAAEEAVEEAVATFAGVLLFSVKAATLAAVVAAVACVRVMTKMVEGSLEFEEPSEEGRRKVVPTKELRTEPHTPEKKVTEIKKYRA